MEAEATKLQEAAYGAQLAAGLRVSDLATAVLISADGTIHHRSLALPLPEGTSCGWRTSSLRGGRRGRPAWLTPHSLCQAMGIVERGRGAGPR